MHTTALQPGEHTRTSVQLAGNNQSQLKSATTWRHRELTLPGQPSTRQVNITNAPTNPPQAAYDLSSLQVTTPLTTLALPTQTETYPNFTASTYPPVPFLFPTQGTELYFTQPTFYPAAIAPCPTLTSLPPYSTPQQTVPLTILQSYSQTPLVTTPFKVVEVMEIMGLITSNCGKTVTAKVDGIARNQNYGTGNIQLGRFNLKVGLHFSSPFTTTDRSSFIIQGKLSFPSTQKISQYLYSQPLGCFCDKDQQKQPISSIPIFLKCDNAELTSTTQSTVPTDANESQEPNQEISKIRDHLKTMNGQRVNANIVFFDHKHVGGIACHTDPASGYLTYFMFKTPPEYSSIPTPTLRDTFSCLEATISHSMSDTELSDYVESLGSESFQNQDTKRKGEIRLFSHDIILLNT
ncbi:hypothetical protein [Endozoicomonas atrinae]|uniref:hypothetical protein n=1 Tax=Endozoicomonas atrinae TaxID=1333660 RepID=UPI003AFF7326